VSDAQVRLVVAGHVDHGKSTLIGRLLHDTGALLDGKYEQLEAVARRRGQRFEFANLLDALQAERDQNITIDTTQIWFTAHSRQYVIIDAPGHKEFLKNMITGAARADAALIVVDATEGVQEQSRRHGYLLQLLGIRQIAVVVNKMDLAGFSRETFEGIRLEYLAFLASIGLGAMAAVPVSAREGDQIASRGARMPWYEGPTVLEAMAAFAPGSPAIDTPLRLPVQGVYRFDHRRIVVGRIESGRLRVGDALTFLPGGLTSRVKSLERWHGAPTSEAIAGDSIGLTLADPLFVERGAIAASVDVPPSTRTEFKAKVIWLSREPLRVGRPYRLRLTTQELTCEVVRIDRVIDGATLLEVAHEAAAIERNVVAEVVIRTQRPIVLDDYAAVPSLGRFVLVDGYEVSGGGVVLDIAASAGVAVPAPERVLERSVGHVARDERELRNRHKGAVVWFTGLSGAGKSTIANKLERALFDLGFQVFVLDGDNVRLGLNRDLRFSAEDRAENIRRVAEVAKLFSEAGVVTLTAFISPYRSDRIRARQIVGEEGPDIPFLEVFVDAPLEVCEQRDPKGLYARARSGGIKHFTGVSDPNEPPEHPDLTLRTADQSTDQCLSALLDHLLPRLTLPSAPPEE
jgi:bifunctional enzyme CysN/CysC